MEDHVSDISADEHEMVNKPIIIMPELAFRQRLWNYFTLGCPPPQKKTTSKKPYP